MTGLEIRCRIDRSRVVILIQCGPEWRAIVSTSAMSTRTGCLLPSTSTNRSTTHEISSFVGIVAAVLLGADSPDHNSNDTEHDSTTDTHHDTDDDLLVGGGKTRLVLVRTLVQAWSAGGIRAAVGRG